MYFQEALKKINGLAYLMEQLPIRSEVGRNLLYELPWLGPNSASELLIEYKKTAEVIAFIALQKTRAIEKFKVKISQVQNLQSTFKRIHFALDDVQLFEIKKFALLVEEMSLYSSEIGVNMEVFPNLKPVVACLDPDNTHIPTFYVYDSYSKQLAQDRNNLKQSLSVAAANATANAAANILLKNPNSLAEDQEIEDLRQKCLEEEDKIRTQLSKKLLPYVEDLSKALHLVAIWDLLIAKAEWAIQWDLSCPTIEQNSVEIELKNLFHPRIKKLREEKKKRYQKVDISLYNGVCLLTGANMSGKTVLLKSIALAQTLAQFGFFVPASYARLSLFDEVFLWVQDAQNENQGLSSFGSEMMQLNDILQKVKQGKKVALFFDELARTTNPEEGRAIVCAAMDILEKPQIVGLISTHYDSISNAKRRLRIKGFTPNLEIKQKESLPLKITIENIQDFMDYRVEEVDPKTPNTSQALVIASILGVDTDLLDKAQYYFLEKD
ncbi:MAG: hypothetical protein RRX93_01380 [Bacteroidales bacterium]